MLLFVLACGLAVTLGLMNFVNLAHCSFAMLGGYVAVTLTNEIGWPFLASLPVAFLAAAVVMIAFGLFMLVFGWVWPGVALALTKDFHTFERCGLVMQPDDKDAAVAKEMLESIK